MADLKTALQRPARAASIWKLNSAGATLLRMTGENSGGLTLADSRYRTLLDVSKAMAEQPTVKAVLHSLRGILSGTSTLHGTELYVLSDDGDSLHVFAFDRDADAPAFNVGTKVLRIGAAAQVLDEQKPVFIPDSAQEMLKHPSLAPFASKVVG